MASFSPDYASGLERARSYREEAKRLRQTAARASAPDISRDFKDNARQYELLAARVELRALAGQRQRDQSSAAEPQKQR